jgi:hypothetical protein
MLLAAVYKSPQRLWSDTDITELLGFRNKSMLAGDMNAKHPVMNPLGLGIKYHCTGEASSSLAVSQSLSQSELDRGRMRKRVTVDRERTSGGVS